MRAAQDGRRATRRPGQGAGPRARGHAESQARGTLRRTSTARPRGRFPNNPDLLFGFQKRLGVVNNKNKADFSYAFAPFSVSDDATFKIVFYAIFIFAGAKSTEAGI